MENESCKHIFDDYATEYVERYMDVDRYKDSLDRFYTLLKPEQKNILDLGCGPGNLSHYLMQKNPLLKVFGIDLSENMIRIAKEFNPKGEFQIGDVRKIKVEGKKLDAVIAGFCLPYLSLEETCGLLDELKKSIAQGALFYFSTIEGDYQLSGPVTNSKGDQLNMYFYTENLLRKELEERGFCVLSTEQITYTDHHSKTVTDLILLAQL